MDLQHCARQKARAGARAEQHQLKGYSKGSGKGKGKGKGRGLVRIQAAPTQALLRYAYVTVTEHNLTQVSSLPAGSITQKHAAGGLHANSGCTALFIQQPWLTMHSP